jgi:hypothetical protein
MPQFKRVRIAEVKVPERHRPLQPDTVTAIIESIEQLGMHTPITVRLEGETPVLIVGRHRLEAIRTLGKECIDVEIFEGDEIEAQMWGIAENLHRAELTALQRDEMMADWVRLTEAKAISAQVAPKPKGGRREGGVRAAARKLGVGRDDVRRAVKVARLSPAAKRAAREAGLDDNRSALLAAAEEATSKAQVTKVEEIAERGAVKATPPVANDLETEEGWRTELMRVWNRGLPEWQKRWHPDGEQHG